MDKRLQVDKLKAAMDQKGLNAAQLAQRLSVSREAVSNWLNSRSLPRPDKLLKLALVVGLGFDELVARANLELEPVVAFRKRGASKTTIQHIAHAQEMGRLLRHLVPYLPFDRFVRPATLKQPSTDYRYLQDLATQVRWEIGIADGKTLDFRHLIKRFQHLQAVLVPVLWGRKEKHENALHIFLPDSTTTWVYLNLDVEVHDFKFWMAHELGHVLAPALRGDEAEDFADGFAGALLFPEALAREAYREVSAKKDKGAQINRVKSIADDAVISPVSVYLEMNRYARHTQQQEIDLESAIYGAAKNLSKGYKTVSEALFEQAQPPSSSYIERVGEVFGSTFFDALRAFLRDRDTGPGYVQSILDIPLVDAQAIHAELT